MNRNLSEAYALEKQIVTLFADVKFGTTGAPTLQTASSKGIKSITRTSAGLFVLTLSDSWVKLLDFGWIFKLAAASFPAAPNCQITASTSNTITFQFSNSAGNAATDPASGEEVFLSITVGRSTAF